MEGKKYTVNLKPDAKKALAVLDSHNRKQVIKRLIQLEADPYNDAKKLKGSEFWRVRVGDFRIIYTIDKGILLVLVIRIGFRKDVYKTL